MTLGWCYTGVAAGSEGCVFMLTYADVCGRMLTLRWCYAGVAAGSVQRGMRLFVILMYDHARSELLQ